MRTLSRPRYLKVNGGVLSYRRRVPKKHQKTLGFKMWNRPCGKVSDAEAIALVVQWTKEDDELLRQLRNPEIKTEVRRHSETLAMEPRVQFLIEAQKSGDLPETFHPVLAAKAGIEAADALTDPEDRLIRYKAIQSASFGPHVTPPTDIDSREEFELVKRKLERRIVDIQGDPNIISRVSQTAFDFNEVKESVQKKYRRHIKKLVRHVGDIPIAHLTPKMLREFRDAHAKNLQATSVRSMFTPIKTMISYALEEELIETNPMIRLGKEKRSVQAIKWQPFTPEEAQRLFLSMDEIWGSPVRGPSPQRRLALWWAVRVLAFTAMRPKEVMDLTPDRVNDKWIRIVDSKTKGADRVIPLHPEISGFVAFFHSGGFDTFKSQKKDRVQSLRHNFQQLIRKKIDPPITDPRKVLYSWRSTFSNAMRRAGVDGEMRRAILGHAEAGALKHYHDGPELFEKRIAIKMSDPRIIYPDPGEDDDLD